jgi:muramidase (phage lysozyme)
MIGMAEGTIEVPGSNNGYDVIVGGTLFQSFADHPRVRVELPNLGIYSTAAGRYQIIERNFDVYKLQLGLHDFGADSQDAIALQMIKECHALDDIDAGHLMSAITKCNSRWASLPGNVYGQRQVNIETLTAYYTSVGGTLSEDSNDNA